ncbi:MAG: hypothetical protein SNJ56_06445, partial [Termitinemataceae bacterium]
MRRFAKDRLWVSPASYVAERYQSPLLGRIYAVLVILITIPYLSIQARSGGILISSVTGFTYPVSSALVVILVMIYVLRGGMKSVVQTDVVQILILLSITTIAFIIIGNTLHWNLQTTSESTGLFDRSGAGGSFPLPGYLATMLLWFLADPMFPQLFQRFFAARSDMDLVKTAAIYPLITGILFFMTIGAGVAGKSLYPALTPGESDTIVMLSAQAAGGQILLVLLVLAGLAALLSTMDSQLLAIATIGTESFVSKSMQNLTTERLLVVLLSLVGYAGALIPIKTILDFLSASAFPAYAVLAPLFFVGLYWKRAGRYGATASLITGVGLVLFQTLFPGSVSLPKIVPPVLFNLLVQLAIFISISLWFDTEGKDTGLSISIRSLVKSKRTVLGTLGICALVLLSIDFWNYARKIPVVMGIPSFVWYSLLLCLLLAGTFWWTYRDVSSQ